MTLLDETAMQDAFDAFDRRAVVILVDSFERQGDRVFGVGCMNCRKTLAIVRLNPVLIEDNEPEYVNELAYVSLRNDLREHRLECAA